MQTNANNCNDALDAARYRKLKAQPQSWMLEYMRTSRPHGKTLDAALDALPPASPKGDEAQQAAEASTPAAPGIDSAEVLRRIDQADVALGCSGLSEHNILRSELREARAAVATLIDASPKGGSEHVPDELPAFLRWCADELVKRDNRAGSFAPGLAESLRGRAIILEHVAAMQATSAEVGE